jgi:hypothetical protein
VGLEDPILVKKEPQRFLDNMAASGTSELRISGELPISLSIKPETARFELAFRLRTDLWSYSCFSCS